MKNLYCFVTFPLSLPPDCALDVLLFVSLPAALLDALSLFIREADESRAVSAVFDSARRGSSAALRLTVSDALGPLPIESASSTNRSTSCCSTSLSASDKSLPLDNNSCACAASDLACDLASPLLILPD